jgi:hypothetical protein
VTPPPGNPLLERAERFVDRRRLIIGLCAAVAVALIAAIPGILTGGDDGRNVRTAEFAQIHPTTTAVPPVGTVNPLDTMPAPGAAPPSPTTTRPALVLGTTFKRPTPTTAAPRSAAKPAAKPGPRPPAPGPTPQPAGTAPPPNCHNSYDPACGPFRWDSDPGSNAPITGNLMASPQTATVGQKVIFTVTGDDPDAAPLQECNIDFNDGYAVTCDPRPAVDPSYCPKQYGPWTPPARQDGKLNNTWDHTYTKSGTYTVTFNIRSAMQECNNPYAGSADVQVTVFVTPASP